MEALFLSRTLKKTTLLNMVPSLVLVPPSPLPPLPFPFLVCQVEFKMKKTDAIRWEKLEGEGQESNIKHFNPSQCTASAFTHFEPPPSSPCLCSHLSLLFFSLLSLSAKINISSCVCLFCSKRRVGSRALLEPFISLTAKVGRQNGRYDSEI